MGWGTVTNIGSTIDQAGAASVSITPSVSISAGALIVCGACDNATGPIGSSQLTDAAGNSYTIIFSTTSSDAANNMAVWFSTNGHGLTSTQAITYSKLNAANGAAISGCSVVNSDGFKLDSGVTKTNSAVNNSNPTVTSNSPKDGGELFFGFASEDTVTLSLSQDAGNGWSFPPNNASGTMLDIMGGNKIPATAVAQTFSPGSTAAVTWIAAIFSFQQGNILSYYEPLSEPVRAERTTLLTAQRFEYANANYYAVPGLQLLDHFPPLAEPVRIRPPLPSGAPPFMAMQISYVQYNFSLKEAFDGPQITINAFAPINAAQVTITEIQSQTTQVTIQELKFTRGYS